MVNYYARTGSGRAQLYTAPTLRICMLLAPMLPSNDADEYETFF